ncbi:PSPB protein, partial [Dasyornis broadbenti]|nr:PSPB protein [Dasyornis broadbenti]
PPGRVLTVATGLGAPGWGCGVPPSAWCQSWVTALRCGALGRCPHLAQGRPDVDACAMCQQLFNLLHHSSNQSAMQVPAGMGDRCHWVSWWVPASATQGGATVVAEVVVALRVPPQLPRQACAWLKLCHGEPGASPAVPVLEAPASHRQVPVSPPGSGGAALSPEALPLPLPLCWLCRTLVARAE